MVLAVGIVGFALMQTRDWRVGLGFAVGLAVVFGVLTLTAKILVATTRRFVPAKLPFTLRQGVADLHRPNNRTLLLLFVAGPGHVFDGEFVSGAAGVIETTDYFERQKPAERRAV